MGFITLGSIASIKGGKRLPAGVSLSKEENDHPYIRIRDLNNMRMLEKTEDFEYVDDETERDLCIACFFKFLFTVNFRYYKRCSFNTAHICNSASVINKIIFF